MAQITEQAHADHQQFLNDLGDAFGVKIGQLIGDEEVDIGEYQAASGLTSEELASLSQQEIYSVDQFPLLFQVMRAADVTITFEFTHPSD
jgi:hypothetical protein